MIALLVALLVFLPWSGLAVLYERAERDERHAVYLPGDHRQWKRWPSSMSR